MAPCAWQRARSGRHPSQLDRRVWRVGPARRTQHRHDRLLRPEQASAERTVQLSDEQGEALECFSPEFEAHYSGDLVTVDAFFVGHLKGVDRVYCIARSTAARAAPGAASTP